MISGCSPKREVVDVINGRDGVAGRDGINGGSCHVSDFRNEENLLLGARIFCDDGSFTYVLNGSQGPQGIQGEIGPQGEVGPQGLTGSQGIQGETGEQGQSCSVHRASNTKYITVSCGEYSAQVFDGERGEQGEIGPQGPIGLTGPKGNAGDDGQPGQSCSQSGTTNQTISFQDYTILPTLTSEAYCKKNNDSSKKYPTVPNCNQWNCNGNGSCSSEWVYYPAVYSSGEYRTQTFTVGIPTFTCE